MGWIRVDDLSVHDELPGEVLRSSPALTVTRLDGWKLAAFRPFKPLVFFAAFGVDAQFRMLRSSLASLHEAGLYDGDVLLMTDREDLTAFIPEALSARTTVWVVRDATDVLDYTCARYRVAEWPGIMTYNPVLYVDNDVAFDAPIAVWLKKIALGDKIFAQGNEDEVASSGEGAGLDHYLDAGVGIDGKIAFNTGILGIPLPAERSELLALVRDAVYRFAEAKGTRQVPWSDQPTVNYVLNMLGQVDGDLLNQAVRWGGRPALHGGLAPRGFMHLWGGEKEQDMEDVLAMMRGETRLSDARWIVYDVDAPWTCHEVDCLPFANRGKDP